MKEQILEFITSEVNPMVSSIIAKFGNECKPILRKMKNNKDVYIYFDQCRGYQGENVAVLDKSYM